MELSMHLLVSTIFQVLQEIIIKAKATDILLIILIFSR